MKLFIAQALITDGQLHWTDDNDPVEVESFLGAFDEVEKAQAFAVEIAGHDRQAENDLIDENETGAHMPELTIGWTHRPKGRESYSRETWTSGPVEFAERNMTVRYQVFATTLNMAV